MSREEKSILVDQEVPALLTSLMKEAQEYILVVTPYIDIAEWGHLKQAIESALKRRVKVRFLIRSDPKASDKKTISSIRWLLDNQVPVFELEHLHAKIYMSEKTTVISSMNLHESSASDSLEIAMVVRNQPEAKSVRDYVFGHLMKLSQPLSIGDQSSGTTATERPRRGGAKAYSGACIRCGRPIALDPLRPLCPDCYGAWSEWKNVDYQENYCHVCGRPSSTSFAKPLCQKCYQQVR